MTLLKRGIIQDVTYEIPSDSISLFNVFKLMEDQNYTVIVSFGYFEMSNIIETEHGFGKLNM